MPILYDKLSTHCPPNSGLTSIRIRIMIDPEFTESSTAVATHVVDCMQDMFIQQLAFRVLSEPANWTIKMAQTSPLGLQIGRDSMNQSYIKDVTSTHTLQMPNSTLFTIELGSIFGK